MADLTVSVDLTSPPVPRGAVESFAVTGANLAEGLRVRVSWFNKDDGFTVEEHTAYFVATSPTASKAESVAGGWSITVDGDVYTASWQFDRLPSRTSNWSLYRMLFISLLDGVRGRVVFDTSFTGTEVTPGTELGRNFELTGAATDSSVATATYREEIQLEGVIAPDLFAELDVLFSPDPLADGYLSPVGDFTFRADCDLTTAAGVEPPPPPPPPPPPCVPVGVFPHSGFATIGGHLVPPVAGDCPVPEAFPIRAADTYTGTPVGVVTPRNYSYLMPIGKTPDQFEFSISSSGDDPMTISGVEWHGWYFNNTRRI